jgi:hypothetical protein
MELSRYIACSNRVMRSRSSSAGNPSLSRKFLQNQTPQNREKSGAIQTSIREITTRGFGSRGRRTARLLDCGR